MRNIVIAGIVLSYSAMPIQVLAKTYAESDFLWYSDTENFKPQIVAIVNKISREHAGCSDIDTASIGLSGSKSAPGDPVYYVTCNASPPFNVWFRLSDADKEFQPTQAISQSDAVMACETDAKSKAYNPTTVDFSRILDVSFSSRQDGRSELSSSFTVKNAMNLELKFNIRCLFEGGNLIESHVTEAR